jgi:hypothetical protein
MVLSLDCLPAAVSRIMDVICAVEGQIKKCLILDLDNTLWGGIIGDDGLENIQLGHGLGIGKVFTELQHWIKILKTEVLSWRYAQKTTKLLPGILLSVTLIWCLPWMISQYLSRIGIIRRTISAGFNPY